MNTMHFATDFLFDLITQVVLMVGARYEYCHYAILFVIKFGFMS
jgi:hypothetical protein